MRCEIPPTLLRWAQFDNILNRAVNALLATDLGQHRRLAVFADNTVETALANMAGLLASVSVVPVNFHLTAEEVPYILEDSAACFLWITKLQKEG